MFLTHIQKLPKNVGDLRKLIVTTGFEWLPKVQKIAQSGHTECTYGTISAQLLCSEIMNSDWMLQVK